MFFCFLFKQKTAYEMRISDWSSDVCSSDLPQISGGDLVERLEAQAAAVHPVYHLGQRVEKLERLADGHADGRRFRLTTSKGEVIEAGAVIIAAGAGAFGPNRPPLDGIAAYEGRPEGSGVTSLLRRAASTEARRGGTEWVSKC